MHRRGQVVIYLVVTLVALTLLALLNVDVFVAVRGKMRVQNAGDAAALAAARSQGELLNQIGRLNIEHISAAVMNDRERCDEIVLEQKRIALLGPLDALRQADDAARMNSCKPRREFAEILLRHAQDVRVLYAGGGNSTAEPYPEPWPGAWMDYALEIEQVAGNGLAVGPDNIEFYSALGGHPLLDRDFYHAIAGRNWCWFKFHYQGLLGGYSGFLSWSPLPLPSNRQPFVNSEVFSLHVDIVKCSLMDVLGKEKIAQILEEGGAAGQMGVPYSVEELLKASILTNKTEEWFFYEHAAWRTWDEMNPLSAFDEFGPMPVIGEVKEQFNVRGAAVIVRCYETVPAVAVDSSSRLTWTAAAKPFGSFKMEDEEVPVTAFGYFVLPSFTASRLVPVDSVGGRNLATSDYDWVVHLRGHIPAYLQKGPASRNCYYCRQLVTWENPVFRKNGAVWLKFNGDTCRRPQPGGKGGRGGTSHAH